VFIAVAVFRDSVGRVLEWGGGFGLLVSNGIVDWIFWRYGREHDRRARRLEEGDLHRTERPHDRPPRGRAAVVKRGLGRRRRGVWGRQLGGGGVGGGMVVVADVIGMPLL